jgi:hypothetical protein
VRQLDIFTGAMRIKYSHNLQLNAGIGLRF